VSGLFSINGVSVKQTVVCVDILLRIEVICSFVLERSLSDGAIDSCSSKILFFEGTNLIIIPTYPRTILIFFKFCCPLLEYFMNNVEEN
jgi:hypothetical protein